MTPAAIAESPEGLMNPELQQALGPFRRRPDSAWQLNQFFHRPQVIGDASGHRRRDSQALMDADEVVVHVMDRERRDMALDLFAKAVRQSGEPSQAHPHREVLPLNIAGRNMLWVGIARNSLALASDALRWTVARVAWAFRAVDFHQHRVINIVLERASDGIQISLVTIGRKLDAVRQAARKILDELPRRKKVASPDHPGANQLGVCVHCNPSPDIARVAALQRPLRHVLLLRRNETPDFVTLNPFAGEIAQMLIQVIRAGSAQLDKQFRNCIFGNAGHANRRTDRVAFD